MTRDFFKDGYLPEDFYPPGPDRCRHVDCSQRAAQRANAILKAELASLIREFEADYDCACCNNNLAQIEAMQRLAVSGKLVK